MRIKFNKWTMLLLVIWPIFSNAQVSNLSVEKYYVADANDATDTLGNIVLSPGTATYRVFVELVSGSK
ncbi:MAG: hypothetical protein ACKPAD_03910, partial [Bacteroidota bacterium]